MHIQITDLVVIRKEYRLPILLQLIEFIPCCKVSFSCEQFCIVRIPIAVLLYGHITFNLRKSICASISTYFISVIARVRRTDKNLSRNIKTILKLRSKVTYQYEVNIILAVI